MLDINLLRKDLDSVVARLQTRKNPQAFLDVDAFKALEAERKTIQIRTEELQSKRNSLSKQIGMLKAKGTPAEVDAVMAEVAGLKTELETSAARLDVIQAEMQTLLLAVPNLPHESVPVGADEHANVEVRRWGTPAKFDFEVKDHVDVGTPLGLDFDMGVKLSGSRFTVMKGGIARMHRALSQFMLDVQTQEHGYTECYVPYAVNVDSLKGTGQLPKFEGDLFAAKKGRPRRRTRARSRCAVPDPHQRSAADQLCPRRGGARVGATDQADRAHAVLSLRSRQLRPRHARHDPPAPVRQGRNGANRPSR